MTFSRNPKKPNILCIYFYFFSRLFKKINSNILNVFLLFLQVRTLFVSGLPMDAKPRELYLLFRAYEVSFCWYIFILILKKIKDKELWERNLSLPKKTSFSIKVYQKLKKQNLREGYLFRFLFY